MFTIRWGQGIGTFSFKVYEWNDDNRKAPEIFIASFQSGGSGKVSNQSRQWQHDHGGKTLMLDWSAGGPIGQVAWAAKDNRAGPFNARHTYIATHDGHNFRG